MIGVYLDIADHTWMPKSEDDPLKTRDLQDALLIHLTIRLWDQYVAQLAP